MMDKKQRKHKAILVGKGFGQTSSGGAIKIDKSSISLIIMGISFLTLQKEDIVAIENVESTTIPFMLGMKVVGLKIVHTKRQSPTFVYVLNFARYNLESIKFDLREFGFVIG